MRIVGRHRRGRLIQEFLDNERLAIKDVVRELGLSYSVVYETIMGRRNNRKVLKYLVNIGACRTYLDLPTDLLDYRPYPSKDIQRVV